MERFRWRFLPLAGLLAASAFSALGQSPAVSAGGKWLRGDYIDPASDRKLMMFALASDHADFSRQPYIAIICTGNGKPFRLTYNADVFLFSDFIDPFNYDWPAIQALVKIDKEKPHKVIWDLLEGDRSVMIDEATAKRLLTGKELKIQFSAFLDTFTIGGLHPNEVREACGPNWFRKQDETTKR